MCGWGGECFSCTLTLFFPFSVWFIPHFPCNSFMQGFKGPSVVLWNSMWLRRRQIPMALPGMNQHRATSAPGLHYGPPSLNLQVLPWAWWRWSSWLFPGGIVSSHSPQCIPAFWLSGTWKNTPLWSHTLTVTPTNYCDRHFLNTLRRTCFYYSEKVQQNDLVHCHLWIPLFPGSLNLCMDTSVFKVYLLKSAYHLNWQRKYIFLPFLHHPTIW